MWKPPNSLFPEPPPHTIGWPSHLVRCGDGASKRTNHHAGESPSARAARVEKGGCSRIRDAATIVSSLTPITSPRTNTRSA
uniref:Uncharacterized protein n=1 Tax=Oryza nivara TaxID=4536 RepID=A0A0E0GZ47_ORYNI